MTPLPTPPPLHAHSLITQPFSSIPGSQSLTDSVLDKLECNNHSNYKDLIESNSDLSFHL